MDGFTPNLASVGVTDNFRQIVEECRFCMGPNLLFPIDRPVAVSTGWYWWCASPWSLTSTTTSVLIVPTDRLRGRRAAIVSVRSWHRIHAVCVHTVHTAAPDGGCSLLELHCIVRFNCCYTTCGFADRPQRIEPMELKHVCRPICAEIADTEVVMIDVTSVSRCRQVPSRATSTS